MRNHLMKLLKYPLCIAILAMTAVTAWSEAIEYVPYDKEERKVREFARITHSSVSSPMGGFILVRRGKDTCAVRFTDYRRGNDGGPRTLFTTGQESFFAEYDWYCQGDGSADFSRKNVKSGHGKVADKAQIGIGWLRYKPGRTAVKCGPMALQWQRPAALMFFPGQRPGEYGYRLAPTRWQQVGELRADDEGLKWFGYDENRTELYIADDDLP
jgi:hypothetical protein